MPPIDLAILAGTVSLACAMVIALSALVRWARRQPTRVYPLDDEARQATADRLRSFARERSADVQAISNRRQS